MKTVAYLFSFVIICFYPYHGFSSKGSVKNNLSGGAINVYPLKMYDNDVADATPGINRPVTIKNIGSGTLSISSISIGGTDITQFGLSSLPSFPATINSGDSIVFFMDFNPSTAGLKTASIIINSDDALNPTTTIPLRGLGTTGLGGANEPSLQAILDLYQIPINVGDDNPATNVINSDTAKQKALILGDEVRIQRFVKAGPGNITITPIDIFGPTASNPIVGMGWYKSGDTSNSHELITVYNTPPSNGQTVNVNYTGTLSFDPVTDTFGFYSRWPFFGNRHLYSEDSLNKFAGAAPHHVRIFPYKKDGAIVPNTYLVAFEETIARLDYQDIVFIVSNVKKAQSNALLFVENPDNFPDNDHFVFSRIQNPWTRDSINYNTNHDTLNVRLHSNGLNPLIISKIYLSDTTTWRIIKFTSSPNIPVTALPVTITPGNYLDATIIFTAVNQEVRSKVIHDTLTVVSNDDKYPVRPVYLNGLWQRTGEGDREPSAQEAIDAFGFTSQTGFGQTDPDLGDSTKLKGDEIKPSFFVRADTTYPVTFRQIAAYHSCCTFLEYVQWYPKGSTNYNTLFTHGPKEGQRLFPRRNGSLGPAVGSFVPTTAFGFKVAFNIFSDASKNPNKEIGIKIWKAIDANGNIIPNAYILGNDYLGTVHTNWDYQDNMYYVTNVKPEVGTTYFSPLAATPSDLDFGEKILQNSDSMLLTLKSLGKTYSNGSSDPVINITSIKITGDNSSEFSADMPLSTSLSPQQITTIKVRFNPLTQGLKIADLFIYYNNASSPLRVPLYGIARAADTIVIVNKRIKSGRTDTLTINGKKWVPDTPYAFDNLQPYTNPAVKQIAATDEDSLYFTEQSSNADKRPFRYEIPLPNGNYVVRLHFAEVFWGAPGGKAGGAGSRVMSVTLENQLRLVNFDVNQEVNTTSAVIKNIPVTVSDGKLNINFSASINRPTLSAVEVYSFVSSAPLSVNGVLNLTGTSSDNGVNLHWINSNETGTKYYEIQRSSNNIDFTVLGVVDAKNLAAYNFIDSNPNPDNNFYRIRQVTFDNEFNYSKIVRIDFSKLFSIKLFPNPAKNKIEFQFNGLSGTQNATLSIITLSGSVVKRMPVVLSNQNLPVNVSTLSSGVYIVKLSTTNKIYYTKFVKN